MLFNGKMYNSHLLFTTLFCEIERLTSCKPNKNKHFMLISIDHLSQNLTMNSLRCHIIQNFDNGIYLMMFQLFTDT